MKREWQVTDSGIDLGVDNLTDIELIGRGGFSAVYSATNSLLGTRVAVKVLAELTTDADRKRFEKECRVMGRLAAHPNVVTIHHAGYSDGQRPYLIMELIEGGTLADLVEREGPVPWRRALGHGRAVAGALAAAHQDGVLHRDIKPENVLLDGDIPKLADFGIASLRDATGFTSTRITASWLHAPPETFGNERDERSDLYSLASTLHTLLIGRPPFWRADDESLNPLINRVLNQAPPPLPAGVAPPAVGDLLQRAMAKDPALRPQSAEAFVAELDEMLAAPGEEAHLTAVAPEVGEDPAVEPDSIGDPGTTPAGRSEAGGPVDASVSVLGGEAGGLAEPSVSNVTGEAVGPGAGAVGPDPGRGRRWWWVAAGTAGLLAVVTVASAAWGALRVDDPAATVLGGDAVVAVTFEDHGGAATALTGQEDGLIVSAGDDGMVRVWDPEDPGFEPIVYDGHHDWIRAVAGLPDGRIASASQDGTVQVWHPFDLAVGSERFELHQAPVASVVALDDGRVVSGGEDAAAWVWNPGDPRAEPVRFEHHPTVVFSLAALDDGRVASAGEDGAIRIWDPDDPGEGQVQVLAGHEGMVASMAVLPDGRLVSGGHDGTIRMWDPGLPAEQIGEFPAFAGPVLAMAVLADGRVVSAGEDGAVRIWDPDDLDAEPIELREHRAPVRSLLALDDGRLVSGGEDGTVLVWAPRS
jgi:hypothetical protein